MLQNILEWKRKCDLMRTKANKGILQGGEVQNGK